MPRTRRKGEWWTTWLTRDRATHSGSGRTVEEFISWGFILRKKRGALTYATRCYVGGAERALTHLLQFETLMASDNIANAALRRGKYNFSFNKVFDSVTAFVNFIHRRWNNKVFVMTVIITWTNKQKRKCCTFQCKTNIKIFFLSKSAILNCDLVHGLVSRIRRLINKILRLVATKFIIYRGFNCRRCRWDKNQGIIMSDSGENLQTCGKLVF